MIKKCAWVVVISTLTWGRICFQAHSQGCWQDSGVCELADWPQFFTGSCPTGRLQFLATWVSHNKAGRAGEQAGEGSKMEVIVFVWPNPRSNSLSLLLGSSLEGSQSSPPSKGGDHTGVWIPGSWGPQGPAAYHSVVSSIGMWWQERWHSLVMASMSSVR